MKEEMTVCDNPECDEVTREPYGWIVGALSYWGSGPVDIHVEVCSEQCLGPGLDAARERADYDEHVKQQEYRERLAAVVLEQACPTCDAKPGEPCRTRHGGFTVEPHAPRRKAGYAALR